MPKKYKPINRPRQAFGRRGKLFYGCAGYPDCSQVFWNKPVNRKCPECGSVMTEKKTKSYTHICSNAQCGHTEKIEESSEKEN